MDFLHSVFSFVISPETSLFMTKSPLCDVVSMGPKNKRLGFLRRGNSLGPCMVIKRDVVLKFFITFIYMWEPTCDQGMHEEVRLQLAGIVLDFHLRVQDVVHIARLGNKCLCPSR